MKSILLAICVFLLPVSAFAEDNSANSPLTAESGLDLLHGSFSSDRNARLYVTRYQPFALLSYELNPRVTAYTVIATEVTSLGYEQRAGEDIRIRLDLSSDSNFFLAQGLRFSLFSLGRLSVSAEMQYEFSLWDIRAGLDSVNVTQEGVMDLDITSLAREHVSGTYNWRRLHIAAVAHYRLWRFTPYLMAGWSVLDAVIAFDYDKDAIDALKMFGYETGSHDSDHYRSGTFLGMTGTEFLIFRTLSANAGVAAAPSRHGWVFAGRVSLIWRP